MLETLKTIPVKKRNMAVIRNQLDHLTQDRGGEIRRFLGKVQALANVAEFTVKCIKCKEDMPYTDMAVKDKIVAGLANVSNKEDVLEGMERERPSHIHRWQRK